MMWFSSQESYIATAWKQVDVSAGQVTVHLGLVQTGAMSYVFKRKNGDNLLL